MVVDDNQPTLKADLALLFSLPPGPHQDRRTVQQSAKGHGRLETRTLTASTDLKGFVDWPGLAIDGKTVRGSRDGETAASHLLSAFRHEVSWVVSQQAVDGKTTEIPVARDLLRTLTLDGVLITGDAFHTQRDTAALIVEKKGPI